MTHPERTAATREELRKCQEWLDACIKLGWEERSLDALEQLWWKYHTPRDWPTKDKMKPRTALAEALKD